MKYKKLSKSQIVISIDRLTRFKPVEDKYLRVFKDIILSNLIEPKYRKNVLEDMDCAQIRDIAVEIFNSSIEGVCDLSVNEHIKSYERSIFHLSKDGETLLDNVLNFSGALKYAEEPLPLNLRWLKNVIEKKDAVSCRSEDGTLFPIEKIVIAEGITEEILLPRFSDICGYNFDKNGVKIIAAGGKNQVVKLYYKLCTELRLPIFVLLDKDAESNEELINYRLREQDKVYLLDSGEFEDLLPKDLIVKTVNNEFKNFVNTSVSELFRDELPTVKVLEEFFKTECLHEFKKSEFANRIKQQTSSVNDISAEVKKIIKEIELLSK